MDHQSGLRPTPTRKNDSLLMAQLFHLPPTAYVREVVFIDPSKPSATCMSVNLSLAQYV